MSFNGGHDQCFTYFWWLCLCILMSCFTLRKLAICVQYLLNNKVLYQMGFELNHDNTGAAIWFWCISLTCNTFFCWFFLQISKIIWHFLPLVSLWISFQDDSTVKEVSFGNEFWLFFFIHDFKSLCSWRYKRFFVLDCFD